MSTPKSLIAEVRIAAGDGAAAATIRHAMLKHRGLQRRVAEELGVDSRLLAKHARQAGIDWPALVAEAKAHDPNKAA